MPTLEATKQKVAELVKAKGWPDTPDEIPMKLWFAFIELGEASQDVKKAQPKEKIIEELVDVIFYIVHAARLIDPNADLDEAFEKKLARNYDRPFKYGEPFRDTFPNGQ